jgi:hypothetical protein
MHNRLIKITAGAAAVVAIALGGLAIGRTGSGSSASATGGPPGAQGGRFPGGPGPGAAVTGTTAAKVKQAALAKYPKGQVEQIMQLPDGSYVAHVIVGTDEVHVLVSKAFEVTGTQQGGGPPAAGGAGGAPPAAGAGGTPPAGATPPGSQS